MLNFETFNANHIEAAAQLALAQYSEEQAAVPILPDGDYVKLFGSLLAKLVDHQLGVVALDAGELVGFLTCHRPWNNHFGTNMGTFSPIHAHGAIKDNRRRIYSQLYQQAARKWVEAGILSHAIALYAHDVEAVNSFFWNGFGMRCVDAIRNVAPIMICDEFSDYMFEELSNEAIAEIVPLKNRLIEHLRSTPMFMPFSIERDISAVMEENARRQSRYFVAKEHDQTIAFIVIMAEGENFVCDVPKMVNICGAYLMPEYRGSAIYTKLLAVLIEKMCVEGYTLCGVNFESFNPTGRGFWLKHFTAYTYSVTRRIDERIYRSE